MNKHRHSMQLLILILVLAGPAFGQQPPPSPPKVAEKQQPAAKDADDVVRISVTLVQVDAVVTDRAGRPVTDLKAEDFDIFEDGKRQRISNFSFVSTRSAVSSQPSPAPSDRTAPPVPPSVVTPDKVNRTIALVVDDLTLSFESTHFVRQALRKFVDEQMQPGDLVAMIRTGAGIGALQQFTTDRRQLYAAIERVRWNPLGRGRVGAFAPVSSGPAGTADMQTGASEDGESSSEQLDQFREDLFAVGTLGALNYVVRGLRQLPGRKSVILLSDGFRMFRRDGDNYRVLESLRRLTDLANRASVVVYTVDARGLQYTGPTAADDLSGLSSIQAASIGDERSNELFETQEGLGYLAQETGGLFMKNTNDLNRAVRRVLADQEGYYLIGYIPNVNLSTWVPRPI